MQLGAKTEQTDSCIANSSFYTSQFVDPVVVHCAASKLSPGPAVNIKVPESVGKDCEVMDGTGSLETVGVVWVTGVKWADHTTVVDGWTGHTAMKSQRMARMSCEVRCTSMQRKVSCTMCIFLHRPLPW